MPALQPASIDAYIAQFPKEVQDILVSVRKTIREAAPEATETISYGMPTYTLQGALVHFAAFKNHIGFYALPSGSAAFQKKLSSYKTGRGSVQFPLNQPMPLQLIAEIVKFRVAENKRKAEEKNYKKTQNINGKTAGKNFMESISAPARRALEAKGLTTLQKLSQCTEKELLALHGVGRTTIPKLIEALSEKGLQLKQ